MSREGFGPLYDEEDAALLVREPDELAPAIESVLLDGTTRERLLRARSRSIERFNHVNDGKAAARVADLIVSLMETGRAGRNPDNVHDKGSRWSRGDRQSTGVQG